MSTMNRYFLPHIINTLSGISGHQENFGSMLHRIENDLKSGGYTVNNLNQDVARSLEVGISLGLLAVSGNNIYRLRFNPNAKPPFGLPCNSKQCSCVSTHTPLLMNAKVLNLTGKEESRNHIYQHASCASEESDCSENENNLGAPRTSSPKTLKTAISKNECPLSICMKKFRMNRARRRKEAGRRGVRCRIKSKRRRSICKQRRH